ncbi:hypothetical protein ES708_32889 [subsurface metagenome]
MNNFAVLNIAYLPTPTSLFFYNTTNNPCHLTCYYTDKEPGRHRTARNQRGLTLPWGAYYCFVAWQTIEQIEAGDTLIHTFEIPEWTYCQTKWFAFRGTVSSVLSPSVSCLFQYHHPGAIPDIEEQLLYDTMAFILPTRQRLGQRLFIPNRTVTKLAFVLENYHHGGTGDVSFTIRRVVDDTLLASKVWGPAYLIPLPPTWLEATFDIPVHIDEEVRILAEWPTATYSVSRNIRFHAKSSNVKPSEVFTMYEDDAWREDLPWDAAYRYWYYR